MANASQFIGSKISLVSKAEIRYEGVLYTLDVKESTISLAKVRAFGTEDRPTERPVPSRDDVYDFIIFRGADIKAIDVIEPPKQGSSTAERITTDPAIIEISEYNSQGQGGSFPRFGGSGTGNSQQPRRQNRNLIEGLLQRDTRQANNQESNQGSERGSSNAEAGRQRSGQFRGGRDGGRRDGFIDFRVGRRDFNFSPRGGGGWGMRGGYRRPQGMLRAPQIPKVTFDQDFDFEKANEELRTKMTQKKDGAAEAEVKEEPIPSQLENEENMGPKICYKKDDFFDAISCEALERAKGPMARPDWRKEVKLNAETFGLSGQRRGFYRPGGYFNNVGYDNRWNFNTPRGGYNNWYNGQGRRAY